MKLEPDLKDECGINTRRASTTLPSCLIILRKRCRCCSKTKVSAAYPSSHDLSDSKPRKESVNDEDEGVNLMREHCSANQDSPYLGRCLTG
jgi:hypothetical protein